MGLLSGSGSMTRYRVLGSSEGSLLERVREGLKRNPIAEIDGTPMEKAVGWTSLESPFNPVFEGSSFVMGTFFAFSMRIDQKRVPSKIVKKYQQQTQLRKLAEEGRAFLSRSEKRAIRDHVIGKLHLRIPATPSTYDVLWNPEAAGLWFFSTLKSANEAFEELFGKSFGLQLLRLFPFSLADTALGLTDAQRDVLAKTVESSFVG